MKEFYADLFEYNHYQNQSLLTAFLTNENKISDRAHSLLSHLIFAHHIWNSRIMGKQSEYGTWDTRSLPELKTVEKENHDTSLSLLLETNLETRICYTTSRGEPFTNSIGEILFHVINHSTYHRAQIATEFRLQGIAPLASEYIFYKRNSGS